MDLLQANFPDRITTLRTIGDLRSSPSTIKFPEDAGRSLDEVESAGEVVQCDTTYLHFVYKKLKEIRDAMECYNFFRDGLPLEARNRGKFYGWQLSDGPDVLLEITIRVVAHLKPMMVRLATHPELFPDVVTRAAFFCYAAKITRHALDWLKYYRKLDDREGRFSKPKRDATVSHPTNTALQIPYLPWQSWCRQLPLQKNSPIIQAMLAKHKGLQPSTTQLFPHQGLLIAERRRQKVDAIVTAIVEASASPDIAQLQMPPNKRALVERTFSRPGVSAVVSQVMAQPKKTEQNSKNFAFGELSPIAARARFIAQLDRDCTTRREKLAIFHGTFLNADEMKAAQDDMVSRAANLDLH